MAEAERTLQENHQISPPRPILSKPSPLNPIKPLLFLLKEKPRGPLQLGMLYEMPPSVEPPRTRGTAPEELHPARASASRRPPQGFPLSPQNRGPARCIATPQQKASPRRRRYPPSPRARAPAPRTAAAAARSSRPAALLRAPPPLRALRSQGQGKDREPPANHSRGTATGGGTKPRPCVPGCEEAAAVMGGRGCAAGGGAGKTALSAGWEEQAGERLAWALPESCRFCFREGIPLGVRSGPEFLSGLAGPTAIASRRGGAVLGAVLYNMCVDWFHWH